MSVNSATAVALNNFLAQFDNGISAEYSDFRVESCSVRVFENSINDILNYDVQGVMFYRTERISFFASLHSDNYDGKSAYIRVENVNENDLDAAKDAAREIAADAVYTLRSRLNSQMSLFQDAQHLRNRLVHLP